MPDRSSAACAGKPTVGDQRNGLIQFHTRQCTGRVEHFTHAGAALWPFVTDHNDVAIVDSAVINGVNRLFLAVEDTGRAGVPKHFRRNGTALDHTAFRRKIAPENLDSAGRAVRLGDRTDRICIQNMGTCNVFADGFSRCGKCIGIQQSFFEQLGLYRRNTSRAIQILHMCRACRRQVAQVGHFGAHLIKKLKIQLDSCLVCDGKQMQYAVGTAAERHIARKGIADRSFIDDIAGGDVLFHQRHDRHARMFCKQRALVTDGRNGAVARQCNSDRFAKAVHAVCRIHSRTAATSWAASLLAFRQFVFVDDSCLVGAHRFKHFRKTDILAVIPPCKHRAAAADDSRNIQANRGHHHAGNNFIAVRDQNEAVQLMRHCHGFHTVRNQLTAGQRIFHSNVSHRNSVADADGRNQDRRTTRHPDSSLDGIRNFIEVKVTRNNLAVSADNADQRPVKLFLGVSHCIEQAAVRCALCTLCHICAAQRHNNGLPAN